MSRIALTLAIFVVAVTSGCGGSDAVVPTIVPTVVSEAEYERRVDAVGSDVFLWFSDLRQIFFYSQDLNDDGRDEVAGHIELIQKRIREQADGLDGVIPPQDAEAAHDELIDGLRDYADELGDFPPSQEANEKIIDAGENFEALGYAPWLTEGAETPECSSRATYSWPNAPWCTQ